MKNETELEKQLWRETLYQSLAKEKVDDPASYTCQYDRLTKHGLSGEAACTLLYGAYGSGVSEFLQRQLQKYSETHKGITNQQHRLREAIRKLNDNIQILAGVTVNLNGKTLSLSQDEINAAKVSMPFCMKSQLFESTAAVPNIPANHGCNKMTLEIRY